MAKKEKQFAKMCRLTQSQIKKVIELGGAVGHTSFQKSIEYVIDSYKE